MKVSSIATAVAVSAAIMTVLCGMQRIVRAQGADGKKHGTDTFESLGGSILVSESLYKSEPLFLEVSVDSLGRTVHFLWRHYAEDLQERASLSLGPLNCTPTAAAPHGIEALLVATLCEDGLVRTQSGRPALEASTQLEYWSFAAMTTDEDEVDVRLLGLTHAKSGDPIKLGRVSFAFNVQRQKDSEPSAFFLLFDDDEDTLWLMCASSQKAVPIATASAGVHSDDTMIVPELSYEYVQRLQWDDSEGGVAYALWSPRGHFLVFDANRDGQFVEQEQDYMGFVPPDTWKRLRLSDASVSLVALSQEASAQMRRGQ